MLADSVKPPSRPPSDELWKAGNSAIRAGLGLVALTGKMPHRRLSPHGSKEPITAYDQWARAAQNPSVTGMGIVCTPRLWVLDIDGPEGWDALFALGAFPLDVPTAVSITSRGAHFWFQTESDVRSRGQGPGFLPHVDLKASGYVVAPPSIHPDTGLPYRWAGAPLVLGAFAYAADPPPALASLLADLDYADEVSQPGPLAQAARGDIAHLVSHLRRSSEGERNGTLNWCALAAGQNGFTLEETLGALLPCAVGIGLTPKESKATIRSGWKAGNAKRGTA